MLYIFGCNCYLCLFPALFLLDDGECVWLWQGWWPRSEDGEFEPAERNAGTFYLFNY